MGAGPLEGRRVLILRARHQSGDLAARLRQLGATPIEAAAITIEPPERTDRLDAALASLAQYDWIVLTSANAVHAVARRLAELELPAGAAPVRVAAVGPATAAAAKALFGRVDLMAETHVGEMLAREMGDVAGLRVLFPAADRARRTVPDALEARGATVDTVIAYRTVNDGALGSALAAAGSDPVDAVLFTSSSTVESFQAERASAAAAPPLEGPARAAVFCIGPVTAGTARELGLPVDAVAEEHTTDGLVSALTQWFEHHD